MLYFSKIKILIIYLIIFFLTVCAVLNLVNNKENFFLSKKINLGLDLQGGSYLLLEVDSKPIINKNLQQKLIELRKQLKDNKIKYLKLTQSKESINLLLENSYIEKFKIFFVSDDNNINFYYNTLINTLLYMYTCIYVCIHIHVCTYM